MSATKLRYFTQQIPFTSSWSANVLTCTTAANYLVSGDVITLTAQDSPQELVNVVVTVIDSTHFTVPASSLYSSWTKGDAHIKFYRTGQTGLFTMTLPRSSGNSAVVQSFVTGSGGASYVLEASLDGVHWATLATVTHAGTSGDNQYVAIEPAWTYIGIQISSIGASTSMVVMTSA